MSTNPSIEELAPYEANTLKLLREIHLNSKFNLKPAEYAVFTTLAFHRNSISYQCNPSSETMATETHMSKSHITGTIKVLVDKGYVIATKKFNVDFNKRVSSQYWLVPDSKKLHDMMGDCEAAGTFMNHFNDIYEIYQWEFNGGSG